MIKKIKCIDCNSINNCSCNIKIYDSNNIQIIDDFTDNNGNLNFYLPYFGVYKIIISNYKCISIIIDENSNDELLFRVGIINKKSPITINLTDKFYKGLKITKGRMILWKMK